MSDTAFVPSAVPQPIPLGQILPWAIFAGLLMLIAIYFIGADDTKNPGGLPVGGLTQITFHNSHLVYAITWYGLAAMTLGLLAALLRFVSRGL